MPQSDPPLLLGNRTPTEPTSSQDLKGTQKPSPRSRTISDVLLAFFKTDTSEGQSGEQMRRRLSKSRSRKGNQTSGGFRSMPASRRPSPPPPQDEAADVGQPTAATRNPGAFGIRDDGSELFSDSQHVFPLTQYPKPWRPQNQSNNGSAQSLKTRRLLYIENSDEAVDDEDAVEKRGQYLKLDSHDADRLTAFTEPIHLDERYPRFNLRSTTSMSLPDFPTAGLSPRSSTHSGNPLPVSLSGQKTISDKEPASYIPSTPTCDSHPVSISHYQDAETTRDVTADRSIQTSGISFDRRHLPYPLSSKTFNQTSPIGWVDSQTQMHERHHLSLEGSPLLSEPPLGPGSDLPATDAAELPLLVASRLLSNQAAALAQYCQATREMSATMDRMARESLEWGAHLIQIASHQQFSSNAPTMSDGMLSRSSSMPASTAFSVGTAVYRRNALDTHTSLADTYSRFRGMSDSLQYDYPAERKHEAEQLQHQGWTSLHRAEDACTTVKTSTEQTKMGDVRRTVLPGSDAAPEPTIYHKREQPISPTRFESNPGALSEKVAGKLEVPARTPERSKGDSLDPRLDSRRSVRSNPTMGVVFEDSAAFSDGKRLLKSHSMRRRVWKSPSLRVPSDKDTLDLSGRTKHWWSR